MSFKTSPILNRLKNLKGWKQSSFPTRTSNYSRDITLALKIFLLLKAYLFLNNFKLIMSQLRTYEKSNKVIYVMLVHSNTQLKPKKIILKNNFIKFPYSLYLQTNKKAIYLLYKNNFNFKELTSLHLKSLYKKCPSTLWLYKNQFKNLTFNLAFILKQQKYEKKQSSWGISNKINKQIQSFLLRKGGYHGTKNFWKKNHKKLFLQLRKLEKDIFFLQKELKIIKYYLLTKHSNHNSIVFYTNLLILIKKTLWKKYFSLKYLTKIFFTLKLNYFSWQNKTKFLKQKKISQFQEINFYFKNKKNKNFTTYQKQLLKFYKLRSNFLTLPSHLNHHKKLIISNRVYNKTNYYNGINFLSKKYLLFIFQFYQNLVKLLNLEKFNNLLQFSLVSQVYWKYLIFLQQYLLHISQDSTSVFKTLTASKTERIYSNKFKLYSFNLSKISGKPKQEFILLKKKDAKIYKFSRKYWSKRTQVNYFKTRFFSLIPTRINFFKILSWNNQNIIDAVQDKMFFTQFKWNHKRNRMYKKNLNLLHTNFKKQTFNLTKKIKSNKIAIEETKKLDTTFNRKYIFSFRKNTYLVSLFLVKYQLKYLLQDFLKKYIGFSFKIKIINSLTEFKNLKLFRLYFVPKIWEQKSTIKIEKKTLDFKISEENKNINDTNFHLMLPPINQYFYIGLKDKEIFRNTFKKVEYCKRKKNLLSSNKQDLKTLIWKKKNYKRFTPKITFLTQQYKLKFHPIKTSTNNLLSKYTLLTRDKKSKDFVKRILPVLVMFMKYLDPQILVNYIAQELEYTHAQTQVLFMLRQILLLIPLKRLIAYRIAIFGRINGAKKARTIFLNKGRIPLQNLSKNINFALGHSRARVGTFGVKMWVYF